MTWFHAAEERPEMWSGPFSTRERAMEDGVECYDEDFWIAEGTKEYGPSYMPNAADLLETIGERAGEEIGDAAEDFPDVSPDAEAELDAFLKAWAEKHLVANFWLVDGKPEKCFVGKRGEP